MVINSRSGVHKDMGRISVIGVVGTLLLLALSAGAVVGGVDSAGKLLVVAWVAFGAMTVAGLLGARASDRSAGTLVWGNGLAAGAMVTSAAVFLLPTAIGHQAQWGGVGVASGLLLGYGAHTVGHRLAHMELPMDRTVAELTAHALSAGAIIGVVYGNMNVSLLLGLAIVSHKGPAGYAAAARLVRDDRDWTVLMLPAAGVGLTAIAASLVQLPATPAVRGVVFGFATGVFLHVAMDFLPRCEIGSEVHDALSVEGEAHRVLDRLRLHAVASTCVGAVAVLLAWIAIAP
jgi:ZIP family zinc transporter